MLVLDANILIRAVLGVRVHYLLYKFGGEIDFVAPNTAFQEARQQLPAIAKRRAMPISPILTALDELGILIRTVETETYARFEVVARQRLFRRDENDWPILATALALGCPIWTEDTDFFGCGVATWTSDRIELFLEQAGPES